MIVERFPLFLVPALVTLQVTLAGIIIGMVLGLVTAFAKLSKFQLFRKPAEAYIYVIRGTPLLLQLFMIYFGMTSFGIVIPSFPSAIIALGIHNGAYVAEIFRGAIQSIDRGQREAALAVGMTERQAMRRIVLPQAFKRAIPPLGNQFIIALKDSSLASTITVAELLLRARQLGSRDFSYFEMLIVAAIFYLAMTTLFTYLLNRMEIRMGVSDYRAEGVESVAEADNG